MSGKQWFLPGEEVLPNDDWTDLVPDRVQRGAGGSRVKTTNKKTLCKGRRLVTRVAKSDRGHGAGVLDAGVSASMITKQKVLADQQHRGGDKTRVSEQRPRRRRLKDASAGAAAWRARQGAGSREWQPRERRARPQRQTAFISREQEHASNAV